MAKSNKIGLANIYLAHDLYNIIWSNEAYEAFTSEGGTQLRWDCNPHAIATSYPWASVVCTSFIPKCHAPNSMSWHVMTFDAAWIAKTWSYGVVGSERNTWHLHLLRASRPLVHGTGSLHLQLDTCRHWHDPLSSHSQCQLVSISHVSANCCWMNLILENWFQKS